jgi:hypothetical protein
MSGPPTYSLSSNYCVHPHQPSLATFIRFRFSCDTKPPTSYLTSSRCISTSSFSSQSPPVSGNQWAPATKETLSRGYGRIGNMDLTTVFYDFTKNWAGLTFTLGEGGPFTFSLRLRGLRSVLTGRKPLLLSLPILVQLPAVRGVDLSLIQESDIRTVQAVLKSCTAIHAIELEFSHDMSASNHFPLIQPYCLFLSFSID